MSEDNVIRNLINTAQTEYILYYLQTVICCRYFYHRRFGALFSFTMKIL